MSFLQSLREPLARESNIEKSLAKLGKLDNVLNKIIETHNEYRPIAKEELLDFHKEIYNFFLINNSLLNLKKRYFDAIPQLLFYNSESLPMLIAQTGFISAYKDAVARVPSSKKRRALKSLYCALLYEYRIDDLNFWEIVNFLLECLKNSETGDLQIIHQNCIQFKLFPENKHDGISIFGEKIYQKGLEEAFTEYALPVQLLEGNFTLLACKKYLQLVCAALHSSGNKHIIINFIKNFEQHITIFTKLEEECIESLLSCFISANSHEAQYKIIIGDFLLEHFKDPRINKTKWRKITQDSLNVMLRWLVSRQLEAFFAILQNSATDRWEERQKFWTQYLNAGHISEAWCILGSRAKSLAKQIVDLHGSYASLYGGDSQHSAILMKIGNLTIVEWSHSGACRVATDLNRDVPELYKDEYTADRLRFNVDDDQIIRHSGSWQYRLAYLIRQESNVAINTW